MAKVELNDVLFLVQYICIYICNYLYYVHTQDKPPNFPYPVLVHIYLLND